MKRLDTIFETVCEKAALLCGYLLILAAGYVSAELIARKLLGISLGGANEVSGYVLAVTTAWSFGYTMLKRSHIRIDVFTRGLSSKARAATDLMSAISMVVFAGIFVWFAVGYLDFVWQRGTRSITTLAMPIWIPVLVWCAGWILFLAVCIYLALLGTRAFLRRDYGEVQLRIGSVMEEEELIVSLEDRPVPPEQEGSR